MYVHCGYPKTATTMLQKWVFPGIEGVVYIGRTYTEAGRSLAESRVMSGIRYQGSPFGSEAFNSGCESLRSLAGTGRKAFVSLEGILAQCLVPKPSYGFSDVVAHAPSHCDALQHVKNFAIGAGFDRVMPIVTLRNQDELLTSFFAEGYMDRYSRIPDIDTFDKFIDVLLSPVGCVDSSAVDYCSLERDLADIFGDGNYLFLLFDWIKSDPLVFASRLADFMNVSASHISTLLAGANPENVRRGEGSRSQIKVRRKNARYYLERAKNILAPNMSLGLGRKIGPLLAKLEYGPETLIPQDYDLTRVRDFYRASNMEFVRCHTEFLSLVESR